MPSAVPEAPAALVALVHDFLKTSGFNKAAKALKKEHDEELEEVTGDSLLDIFKNSLKGSESAKKKRKAEEEEEEEEEKPSKKSKKAKKEKEVKEEEEEEEKPAEKKDKSKKKKAKKEEEEEEEKEEEKEEEEEEEEEEKGTPSKGKKGPSTPFKRIQEDQVSYLKVKGGRDEAERLKDNTFESKGGDAFASKASDKLIQVRGKNFTREKNKKKRNTFFHGGAIDMNSNSVKFEDSDDE